MNLSIEIMQKMLQSRLVFFDFQEQVSKFLPLEDHIVEIVGVEYAEILLKI